MNESNRRIWIAVGVIVVVGLGVGVGAALLFGAGSGKHTVTGVVAVIDPGATISNGTCTLSKSAPPVNGGTKVQISNQDKQVLGTSALGDAKVAPGSKKGMCEFTFAIAGVPKASTYYVQVGEETPVSYTHSQLSDAGWAVSLNVSA